ncbi:MAG: IPTL-CTERM sorting domain-containing protein [Usitatibacter sp.]
MDLNPPLNVAFPQGFFDFTLQGCVPGSTITMTMVYPSVLPQGTQYWKYGPAASAHPTPFWFHLPATIAGNAVTFTITDGATDDGDFSTDGRIVDPSGPGVPFNSSDVPSLGEWALVAMASLLLASGLFAMRRRAVRRR